MHLRPQQHIDLTGRLSSLKSSLTPDCKHFEPARPFWQIPQRSEPTQVIRTLFWAWLIVTALGCAIIASL
jgi:hypothetical protein